MSDYVRLLRANPDFERLWLAQVISLAGDWFNTIVLSTLVAEYSGNSGRAVSGFLLARLLPPLIFSPVAGVLVDRFDRKRLLILSDVLRAVVVMLMVPVVAAGPDALWLVLVLTILQFLLSAIFEPARSSIMPRLLRGEDLVPANALSSATWSVMLAVGAIAGGIVARVAGVAGALGFDALTFALSAVLIRQISVRKVGESIPDRSAGKSDTSFREGLRFVRTHPETGIVLLVKLGQSLGNVDALMTFYATTLFVMGGDSRTPLSFMYAAFGVGAIIGPLALNRFSGGSVRTMRRLIVIGFAWITLGWLVLAGASTLEIVLVALVIRAMGGSVNWTYSSVILQKCTPNEYLGRMFSLDMAGFQLSSAISILLTGVLLDAFGEGQVRLVVLLMGGISLVPLALWTLVTIKLGRQEDIALAVGD